MTARVFNAASLKTPEGVRGLMESSKSEREWNENCDAVKAANGDYPEFWFQELKMSGLAFQPIPRRGSLLRARDRHRRAETKARGVTTSRQAMADD